MIASYDMGWNQYITNGSITCTRYNNQTVQLNERMCLSRKLVSDDDSSMRLLLHHKTVHDKGQLQLNIPQPVFMCDPLQRIKVVSTPIL